MASVLTSWDLYKGKTGNWDKTGILSQPQQLLPRKEKNKAWREENMDWWEHIGIMQLKNKFFRLEKNYNLASGVIDKADYIPDVSNEYNEMIDILTKENQSPYEIRFYPIIPNVINVLLGEFSKRNTKVNIKSVDQYAINEMLEKKKEMITNYVVNQAKLKVQVKLAEQGIPVDSEEGQQAQEQIMSLPEIQEFFRKSYRSIPEQWATHELAEAEERFKISELESQSFKDKLTANEQFWHIGLLESDYYVEIWNPMNSFYHKSPDIPYISDGNYVGRIHLLSIPDIIDKFGYLMEADQIEGLQTISRRWSVKGQLMPPDATTTDFWNTTKKPSEQIQSIYWHQAVASETWKNNLNGKPLFEWLKEDENTFNGDHLMVTEVYWKSQKKLGHLKQIDENGQIYEDFVTEDFDVTLPPKYDTTINKKEGRDNLIYGQHIDWLWVNEIWKGIKIGMGFANNWAAMSDGFDPIYLDIKPLPFQFKADGALYNAKLPVEGFVGYNRNVKKTTLVDQMKPFQIGFNMVNNQIMDLLVDEVGKVILLDQNMIPKNSLDGSWGKYNFAKSFQVMKNFGILPIDNSITNTEVPTNFNQTQAVDLTKTDQIVSRIQLAEYFKDQCFNTVGITRQRLGNVTSSESATGVEYSVNNSYAQTEMYFVEHINYLMPRVKEMILNAAQYINAHKPTVQKTYINKNEENIFFEIEGTKILLSDLKIYCNSTPDQKAIIDQLKQLAVNNNTSGASIFDLAKIIQSNSVSEIIQTLQSSVERIEQQQQADRETQEKINQETIEAQAQQAEAQRQFDAEQADLDRENERYVAEVRSVGFGKNNDLNQNQVPDPLEVSKLGLQQSKIEGDISLKQQKLNADTNKELKDREIKAKELELKRRQLEEDVRMKEKALKVQQANDKADIQIAKMKARQKPKGS